MIEVVDENIHSGNGDNLRDLAVGKPGLPDSRQFTIGNSTPLFHDGGSKGKCRLGSRITGLRLQFSGQLGLINARPFAQQSVGRSAVIALIFSSGYSLVIPIR
jgi:hypothetical protein